MIQSARSFLVALSLCLGALLFAVRPATATNPGVVEINTPAAYTNVIVVSDVHGHFRNIQKLLKNSGIIDTKDHWSGKKSLLIVVGDSIDKGNHSLDVLRLWMRLRNEAPQFGGRVVVLLGNHEAEFLNDPRNDHAEEFVRDGKDAGYTLFDLVSDARPIGHFLRSLPVAALVGKWVFCHSGWVPNEGWTAFVAEARTVLSRGKYGNTFLLGDDSILEKKTGANGKKWYTAPAEIAELERRLTTDGLYGVVLGHQPEAFGIQDDVGIFADGRLIKVDSGMGDDNEGHLLWFSKPGELAIKARPGHVYSVSPEGNRRSL